MRVRFDHKKMTTSLMNTVVMEKVAALSVVVGPSLNLDPAVVQFVQGLNLALERAAALCVPARKRGQGPPPDGTSQRKTWTTVDMTASIH